MPNHLGLLNSPVESESKSTEIHSAKPERIYKFFFTLVRCLVASAEAGCSRRASSSLQLEEEDINAGSSMVIQIYSLFPVRTETRPLPILAEIPPRHMVKILRPSGITRERWWQKRYTC